MLPKVLFGYFAMVILFSGIAGITRKNLVYSLLWILLMLIHIGGLYLMLNAEFLAMVQIIVYAGAILVMFLFVVFLLNLKEEVKQSVFIRSWQTRLYASFLLLFFALTGAFTYKKHYSGNYTIELIEKQGHTKTLGLALFNDYLFPFLILGFILLVPLIGVGISALKRKTNGTS
ncbi:MAG: NADH-quinone oxidoreductase subunit J [Thermodesulfovibrio sp.]|jgi:NADH-quinone oxidoreductase subunit J|uniref:NADH-quinone oxidoreductase subunit J n=1 Tax=Thermodesulfovibrio obliviosus TaxID=3118332 RepID=A0AAU8H2D9_9BACT